ncbi:hypothetical protein KIN20_024260 [Parelaphostrongylus tenuis]|uniref:Uncharacterized protein n=1 Tax=Parelaphostrongylus tenuis TaxID=148309 RepID=A0AAD5QVV0_PARTN|nr:hypothetical protein KIN20_024260 [Parelaphostrongylus tenuis]
MLNHVEKALAKARGIFPNVSLKSALEDLIAANNILPDKIENIFFIGKTYDAMGLYANAKVYLKKVLTMTKEPRFAVESEHAEEAAEILRGKSAKGLTNLRVLTNEDISSSLT